LRPISNGIKRDEGKMTNERNSGGAVATLIEKSIAIALHAHQGQKDKAGAPMPSF
jgi:hypothetical protein